MSTPPIPSLLTFPRGVAQLDATGSSSTIQVTSVNTYSATTDAPPFFPPVANNQYFMVGNAGNGSGTEPVNVVSNTGVQLVTPPASAGKARLSASNKERPARRMAFEFGFSVAQLGSSGHVLINPARTTISAA